MTEKPKRTTRRPSKAAEARADAGAPPAALPQLVRHKLVALRKERGLNQIDVAAAIGYSRTAISGVESAQDDPGRQLLEALARFYDTTVGELYSPGSPKLGELVEDQDELALLGFWRSLDEAGKRLILLSLAKGRDA